VHSAELNQIAFGVSKYCDEAYAIFDARNTFKKSLIDRTKVKAFLKTVARA
jgi:hypothetical protein